MGRVVVISTGGTVSMVQDAERGGAVPTLDGAGLLAGLPAGLAEVQSVEHSRVPSGHFTVDDIWKLRSQAAAFAAQTDVDGIVIVMGTDVLEEVAYLIDLTVPGDVPIVLTGAMRTASHVGWDGGANILASIRVALARDARGMGALVVMNDEVHAARFVTKTHSQALDTFKSPDAGPLGHVDSRRVVIDQRVTRRLIDCDGLELTIPLIRLTVGVDDGFLQYALQSGARGVVLETFGSGRVPPWWMPAIRRAIVDGVLVVATTRCVAGTLNDTYGFAGAYKDLRDAGVVFAQGLNGLKARIKLMVALNAARIAGGTGARFFDFE